MSTCMDKRTASDKEPYWMSLTGIVRLRLALQVLEACNSYSGKVSKMQHISSRLHLAGPYSHYFAKQLPFIPLVEFTFLQ